MSKEGVIRLVIIVVLIIIIGGLLGYTILKG